MQRWRAWAFFLPVLGLVGCDHATKAAARAALGGGPTTLIPGVLDLRLAENHDTAFGLFRLFGLRPPAWALATLAALVIAAVAALIWSRRAEASRLELAAFALVLGGAIGNVLDRAVRGFVVDFVHLHHWPIFNVADVAVVAGGALLVLASRPARSPAPLPDPGRGRPPVPPG